MGWFDKQVQQRRENDSMAFSNSFLSLAGLKNFGSNDLTEEELRDNYVIEEVLKFFNHEASDIPEGITTLKDKVTYVARSYNINYRKIELSEESLEENYGPILTFTREGKKPHVLIPKKNNGYFYKDYDSTKKKDVDSKFLETLSEDCYVFYEPLPEKKITIVDYIKFMKSSIPIGNIVLLIIVAIIGTGVGMVLPYLTRILTGDVVENHDVSLFIPISVYVVAAAVGGLIITAYQGYVTTSVTVKLQSNVQQATMMRVLNLPAAFFKKYNTGELSQRFSSVVSLASMLVNSVSLSLLSALMSFAYLVQMVGFAASLIIPTILILLVSTGFSIAISFLQKKISKVQMELSSKKSGLTYETINGIQKIRLSGSEKRVFVKWADVYSKAAKLIYNPPLILRLSTAISFLITLIGNIVIYLIAATTDITVGDYMAFTTSYGVLSAAFAGIAGVVSSIAMVSPVFNMARPILEEVPEKSEDKITVEDLSGSIKMDHISFRYGENLPNVVDDLSLDIKSGDYIAIVGKTGCGKSTLVRLLLGFEEPNEGHIYYDGMDINDVNLPSLRRNIGTVTQNGTLFHADIFSNIIISKPDATKEEAWAAAEIANIADDIREMPMGMNTVISEGQGSISGGQKQRIMIARAIVHRPNILIFDEATSALDNVTQKSISESIDRLKCTRIVIAHRLSTIQNANRIIMLDGGKIIEDGSYDELIKLNGRFAELVDRQRLDTDDD